MKIRIMIADENTLFREGLKCLFKLDNDFEIVAEISNEAECLNQIEYFDPDILLLDISMLNEFEILNRIDRKVKVLILTEHSEQRYLCKAFNRGVDGYILKKCSVNELKRAIRSVISGNRYIYSELHESEFVDYENNKLEDLSNRELEVLMQIAEGKMNKEIASNLNIAERTVKNHISSIFKKLSVSDRTQAAIFAIKNEKE